MKEITRATATPVEEFTYNVNHQIPEIDARSLAWIQAFHIGDGSLESIYMEKSLLFPGKDKYLLDTASICDFYKLYGDSFKINEYTIEFRIQLPENSCKVYETGYFITNTDETYQFLTVWSKNENTWFHEIDVIAKKDPSLGMDSAIDTSRNQWIVEANAHNARKLAKALYNEDFVYYNRGNVYEGYDNLADMYSYMDSEHFNVTLEKDICVMVQNDLAFEIGTWSNSGSGKYIIIWRLKDEVWGIHLDTNW